MGQDGSRQSPPRLSDRVLADLISALEAESPNGSAGDIGEARVDLTRAARKGVPEVIFAEGKTARQVADVARAMLAHGGRAIVSRVSETLVESLRAALPEARLERAPGSRTLVLSIGDVRPAPTGGRVAIITAGTSDLEAAGEARVIAEEMGCEVEVVADVGVAGLHRLFRPLRRILDEGVDAIIVAAGMDGALPSVVAGLVPVPVIGLPTSVGYGFGGGGEAALMSMLQTCAPGLTVVNIDNGVGAGAAAGLIANAAARARRGTPLA